MLARLMENKNLLIIALQLVLIIGLVVYFNKRNKSLLIQIQDLTQRVDEQEDLLQKHEDIIKKLVNTLNKLLQPKIPSTPELPVANVKNAHPKFNTTNSEHVKVSKRTVMKPKLQNQNLQPVRVSINTVTKEHLPVTVTGSSSDDSTDSEESSTNENLDDMLAEELQELQELDS